MMPALAPLDRPEEVVGVLVGCVCAVEDGEMVGGVPVVIAEEDEEAEEADGDEDSVEVDEKVANDIVCARRDSGEGALKVKLVGLEHVPPMPSPQQAQRPVVES